MVLARFLPVPERSRRGKNRDKTNALKIKKIVKYKQMNKLNNKTAIITGSSFVVDGGSLLL